MKQLNTTCLTSLRGRNYFWILAKNGTFNELQFFKKGFVSIYNQNISTIKNKIVSRIALFLMLIFSIATLSNCIVTTHGKTPERLDNDEIKIKIYSNLFAKFKDGLIEEKLKQEIDKELSDNNYVDYIVLDRSDVTYRIKLFKSIQDKLAFIDNIPDQKKYLDSLINCPNGKYAELAKLQLSQLDEQEAKRKEIIANAKPLSQVEIAKITDELQLLAVPFSLKELQSFFSETSNSSINHSFKNVARPNSSLRTHCVASKDKVEILTTSSPLSAAEGLASEDGRPPKSVNPQLLFVLSKPMINNINTIGFADILIFETNNKIQSHLIFKNGEWLNITE